MSVIIVKRRISPDPRTGRERFRWHVRYQAHRRSPIVHLGSFESETLAKLRRQSALEDVARGRAPSRDAPPQPVAALTIREANDALYATLQDLAPRTLKVYRQAFANQPRWLAETPVDAVSVHDVQRYALELGARFKRSTTSKEIGVLRRVLDHAGVDPNPAASRRVRLPRAQRRVYRLPTRAQLEAMRAVMPARAELMLLLEHTGLRIGEAAALRWQDIDHERRRLLVTGEVKTPASRRWVEHLPGCPPFPTPPPGAEPGDRVFRAPSPESLTGMIRVAHLRHGTFLMSAHEFRHLHASRLLHDGTLSPAQIAARLGHATPTITLNTYTHVVPPSE